MSDDRKTSEQRAARRNRANAAGQEKKPWMVLAGGLKHLAKETRRIERVIEAEFETIEPEDRL